MNWYLYLYLLLAGTILVVLGLLLNSLKNLINKLNPTLNTINNINNNLNVISAKTNYINEVIDKVITKNTKNLITSVVALNSLDKIFRNKKESKNLLNRAVDSSMDVLKVINILK